MTMPPNSEGTTVFEATRPSRGNFKRYFRAANKNILPTSAKQRQ
jgi:hypothetical protein